MRIGPLSKLLSELLSKRCRKSRTGEDEGFKYSTGTVLGDERAQNDGVERELYSFPPSKSRPSDPSSASISLVPCARQDRLFTVSDSFGGLVCILLQPRAAILSDMHYLVRRQSIFLWPD